MEKIQKLNIARKITLQGIDVIVENQKFSIVYPGKVWQGLAKPLKELFSDNITFAETNFLPIMLGKKGANYNFGYPLGEPFLFKNQLFDMLDCERSDGVFHLSYLKSFYNLEFNYLANQEKLPKQDGIGRWNSSTVKAVLPFSFGKESLVTFALCLELGIEPILVYCQEPVQPYEEKYKLNKLERLTKEFNVQAYFIKHQPGLFRYGRAFNLKNKTEIGWGSQTTLLSLLVLPFVYHHQARYILTGSEYLNNDISFKAGWKIFYSADQTAEMSLAKNALVGILTNGQCEVKNSLEPLEELLIFFLLNHRYPKIAPYMFSCMAEKPLLGGSQWCHNCHKCNQMFLNAVACGFDPAKLGFKKNLLEHSQFFDECFSDPWKAFLPDPDLEFSFMIALKRGLKFRYLQAFQKTVLPKIRKKWNYYNDFFTSLKPADNLPLPYRDQMMKIFQEEINCFKKILP